MPEWKSIALDGDEPADSPGDEDAHKTRTRRTPKPLTRSHGQKGPGLFW